MDYLRLHVAMINEQNTGETVTIGIHASDITVYFVIETETPRKRGDAKRKSLNFHFQRP